MTFHFKQAYQQTPWRFQIKWAGRFLLVLAVAATIAGLYLSISAQVATIIVQVEAQEDTKRNFQGQIADLKSQLAENTSSLVMSDRAKALGFVPAPMDKAVYLVVPGYFQNRTVYMAPPPGPDSVITPLIKPVYTQSLWEWMFAATLLNEEAD